MSAILSRFLDTVADALREQGIPVTPEAIERAAARAAEVRDAYDSGDRAHGLAVLATLALRAETAGYAPLTQETLHHDEPAQLDTTGLAEAVPDGAGAIKFLAEERNTFEVYLETDYLDAHGLDWRAILADPAGSDRTDFDWMLWEGMALDDRRGGSVRWRLVPTDRTPVRFRLARTASDGTQTIHDVTVTADLLDANSIRWRPLIDAPDPAKLLGTVYTSVLARVAAAQLGLDADDPRMAHEFSRYRLTAVTV